MQRHKLFTNINLIVFVIAFLLVSCTNSTDNDGASNNNINDNQNNIQNNDGGVIMDINLKWLGHDAFLLKTNSGKNIYFDPFNIKDGNPKADFIFITHGHYDHCSIEDVKKIAQQSTIIITTPDCLSKFTSLKIKNVTTVSPGNKLEIQGMKLEVVPAYNINKTFHPKEQEWVGYILEVDGKRIYHAGDTDLIPEMNNIKNIDYAFLPVSGTYVMTADEAVKACDIIRPKHAIPMHYGNVVGNRNDAETFKKNAKCDVIIL